MEKSIVIDRGPAIGTLLYRERLSRSGIYLATLVTDTRGTYAIPPLDRATLHRITPTSLTIYGLEVSTRSSSIKANAEYWNQVWWCVHPHAVEAPAQL